MSNKEFTPRYEVPDFPSYLGIAVSYACNYKCLGCIHGNKEEMLPFLQTRQKFMSVDLFRSIIDEIAERHPPINLTSPGETLAHPEIYDMIAYASKAGVDVEFDTNGSLVSPEELAGCGARHVTFSIDGMTQDAYGAYRRGGNLQQVLSKLEDLVSAVQRRNANMNIYLKYLVNSYTEDTLDEARKYFEGLPGVTLMIDFFRPPSGSFEGYWKSPLSVPIEAWEQWRPRKRIEYDMFVPDHERGVAWHKAVRIPFDGGCYSPFKNMYINTDGEAFACCMLALMPDFKTMELDTAYSYGNVREKGVCGVFYGENARDFRQAFSDRKGKVGPCVQCWANRVRSQQEAVVTKGAADFKTLLDW